MKYIDTHCDTIAELYYKKLKGEPYSLYDNDCHIDIPKLIRGGSYVQCFAMFTHLPRCGGKPYEYVNALIDVYDEEMKKNAAYIAPVLEYGDIEKNEAAGKLSALLTLEEGECCEGSKEKLKALYDRGARLMNITWNYKNSLGHPNISGANGDPSIPDTVNGLTETGREIVEYMKELHMVVDVSHASDKTFYDVAEIVKGPFVASHSNCREICGHPRNLTDDMIRTLAGHGGVSGINFCRSFVKTDKEFVSADDMADHVLHFIKVGGEDCVGIGTDFDGISNRAIEVKDPSYMPLFYDALLKRGLSEDQADKVFYRNMLRVLREII